MTFGAGSFFSGRGQRGRAVGPIVATGAATLNGGTVQVLAAPGNYALNTSLQYPARRERHRNVRGRHQQSGISAPSLSYDADDVFLTLIRNASAFSSVAQTFNQRAVARRARCQPVRQCASAGYSPAHRAAGAVRPSMRSPARCMPRPPACWWTRACYVRGRYSAACARRPMAARPAWRRCRSAGRRSRSPMANRQRARLRQVADRHQGAAHGAAAGSTTSCSGRRVSAPAARSTGDGNAASCKRDLAGFLTGFDTRFGGNWRAGIAAGYTASRNTLDGRGSGQCRERASRSLRRRELRRAQSARRRRLCVPFNRHRPHHRFPGLLRSRHRALRWRHRTDFRRGRLRLCVRQSRGRAVRGRRLGASQDRCCQRAGRARPRSACGQQHSRSAIRRSASAPPA